MSGNIYRRQQSLGLEHPDAVADKRNSKMQLGNIISVEVHGVEAPSLMIRTTTGCYFIEVMDEDFVEVNGCYPNFSKVILPRVAIRDELEKQGYSYEFLEELCYYSIESAVLEGFNMDDVIESVHYGKIGITADGVDAYLEFGVKEIDYEVEFAYWLSDYIYFGDLSSRDITGRASPEPVLTAQLESVTLLEAPDLYCVNSLSDMIKIGRLVSGADQSVEVWADGDIIFEEYNEQLIRAIEMFGDSSPIVSVSKEVFAQMLDGIECSIFHNFWLYDESGLRIPLPDIMLFAEGLPNGYRERALVARELIGSPAPCEVDAGLYKRLVKFVAGIIPLQEVS